MEKKKRAIAKSKFTRQESLLTEMLDNKAAKVIVSPQYEKFIECWNSLEGVKYLEGPGARYRDLIKKYADFLNSSMNEERAIESASRKEIEAEKKEAAVDLMRQEQKLKYLSAKAELEASIDSFSRLVKGVKESLSKCSEAVKQSELQKVETEFRSVKALLVKLVGIDESKEIIDIETSFIDRVEKI